TFCAGKVGLRLDGHGTRWPVLAGLGGAIAVAIYVAIIDVVLFRSTLSASSVASLHTPLNIRLSYFMLRAFNENVIYRLFVFSSLLYLPLWFYNCRSGVSRMPHIPAAYVQLPRLTLAPTA
ncbi:MAG TPA: hypothetical protein VKB94_00175, partial [Rhizomicrobium sp.]|nr:hypothetical protein [Rhizomicrobium sp.]